MGVVFRQSIKTSIVSYIGLCIGLFNMLFIYKLDDFETFGFFQLIVTTGVMLSPIFTLGVRGVITRFFPYFKTNSDSRAAFFTFSLLVGIVGALLLLVVGWLLILPALEKYISPENNFETFVKFSSYIYLITITQMFIEILDFYIQNFRRVALQTVFTNLFPKIVTGALVYSVYIKGYDFSVAAITAVGMNAIILFSLFVYLYSLGELRLTYKLKPHFSKKIISDIRSFAIYAIIGTIGNKIALQIDTVSLGAFTDEQTVGIFRIIVFAAGVIDIPLRAMTRITAPLVAQSLADNDLVHVNQLYRRSAHTLTLVGCAVFTVIIISLSDLFVFLGEKSLFTGGIICFALLGASKIFNMITSINHQIIIYSNLYKYNHFLVILLALLNIYLNWLMIAQLKLGIVGAALATFSALTIYNCLRSLLVYFRFKMHPFSITMLINIAFSAAVIFTLSFLPNTDLPALNIVVKSTLVGTSYLAFIYLTPFNREIKSVVVTAKTKAVALFEKIWS